MNGRPITEHQALSILQILIEECGYTAEAGRRADFVRSIVKDEPRCLEYRFMGALGSGGKFRNNGNNDNVPYVDCYAESSTPAIVAMIDRANKQIAAMFAENRVVGHTTVGDQKFAIMSGPCKGCGATNYGISTSGPDYCGPCACGVPPEVSRLNRELQTLREKHIAALLALQVATGFKVDAMTPQMKDIGTRCLERFKAGQSMFGEGA